MKTMVRQTHVNGCRCRDCLSLPANAPAASRHHHKLDVVFAMSGEVIAHDLELLGDELIHSDISEMQPKNKHRENGIMIFEYHRLVSAASSNIDM